MGETKRKVCMTTQSIEGRGLIRQVGTNTCVDGPQVSRSFKINQWRLVTPHHFMLSYVEVSFEKFNPIESF